MHVRSLDMRRFMAHTRTHVELPPTGVVVVTGENGAGKSSLPEAVAWGAWGKMLRGTTPYRTGVDEMCEVTLATSTACVKRERQGRTKLSFTRWGQPPSKFDTATQAQDALTSLLGPFDLWRRSHVFSSADAAHFSLATDAVRKQLIETFLGLDRFDHALRACRDDLRVAETKVTEARVAHDVVTARLEGARTRLSETKRGLATLAPEAPATAPGGSGTGVGAPTAPKAHRGPPGRTVESLVGVLAGARREVAAARDRLRAADRAGADWAAEARRVLAVLARLREATCPTCTQPIPTALRTRLQREAHAAQQKADAEQAEARADRVSTEALIEELEEEVTVLQRTLDAHKQADAVASAARRAEAQLAKQRASLEQTLREASEQVHELCAQLEELRVQIEDGESDVAELEACAHVLGYKGVRAHILGRSLRGIEAVANVWLARMHPTVRIALHPYAELKKGGVDDSISLEVQGAGAGQGYRASSQGERRRIDIALLLGLAEVSAAARGEEPGTLWFDEVFDCLDDAGVEAVVEVLREKARARAVVVITHSKALMARLPDALRLHVTDGGIAVG